MSKLNTIRFVDFRVIYYQMKCQNIKRNGTQVKPVEILAVYCVS